MKEEQTPGATPPECNKIFGVKGATRASVNLKTEASDPNTYKSRGYEDKYEDDQLGDELGDEARIWRVMLDEGRAYDAAMLPRFRDHLDVDLVFAGLFSAIVTTFVAQTSQPSETNDSVMSVALLSELVAIQRAWAANIPVESVPAINTVTVPVADPWINRFWFLSLVFSLFAAFGAVIVRQWLQEYESDISGPPKRRALVRHYRHVGLLKWKVHLIVPILPMLLHVSLLLFFLGLILYVGQSDPTMSHGIIALTALIYLLYIVTTVLPVFYSQCPYRSPLSTAGYWIKSLLVWLYRLLHHQSLSDALKTPGDHEWGAVSNIEDNLIPDSLDWATQASSDLSVAPLVVQAVSALRNDPDADKWADLPYAQLLRDRVIPWFFNTLDTRRMVLNWAPGRENKLQRMACALLLIRPAAEKRGKTYTNRRYSHNSLDHMDGSAYTAPTS